MVILCVGICIERHDFRLDIHVCVEKHLFIRYPWYLESTSLSYMFRCASQHFMAGVWLRKDYQGGYENHGRFDGLSSKSAITHYPFRSQPHFLRQSETSL